jgi:hypothetical protein
MPRTLRRCNNTLTNSTDLLEFISIYRGSIMSMILFLCWKLCTYRSPFGQFLRAITSSWDNCCLYIKSTRDDSWSDQGWDHQAQRLMSIRWSLWYMIPHSYCRRAPSVCSWLVLQVPLNKISIVDIERVIHIWGSNRYNLALILKNIFKHFIFSILNFFVGSYGFTPVSEQFCDRNYFRYWKLYKYLNR